MSALFVPTCGRPSAVSSILTAITGLRDGLPPVSGLTLGNGAGAAPDDGGAGADVVGVPLELLVQPARAAAPMRPMSAKAAGARLNRVTGLVYRDGGVAYRQPRHTTASVWQRVLRLAGC